MLKLSLKPLIIYLTQNTFSNIIINSLYSSYKQTKFLAIPLYILREVLSPFPVSIFYLKIIHCF